MKRIGGNEFFETLRGAKSAGTRRGLSYATRSGVISPARGLEERKMTKTTGFWANLRNAAKFGHAKSECCAHCGRTIGQAKSKPSGDPEMPLMHLRGACSRIDREITANLAEAADVDATRRYMASRNATR